MFHTCIFRFYQTFGWKFVSWCYEGLVVLTTFSSTKSGVTSPITSPWYPSPKRSRSTCNMQSLVVKNSDKKFNKRWNWTFLNPLFLFYCAEWSFRSAHNQLPCLWFWLYFPDRKKMIYLEPKEIAHIIHVLSQNYVRWRENTILSLRPDR